LKVTGIVRKIDDLGRIVLPKELRHYLNISSGDDFEIFIENNIIMLKKYSRLTTIIDKIKFLVDAFNKNIDFSIFVTSKDIILNYNDEKLLSEVSNIIKERKNHINEIDKKIKITENLTIDGKYIILPIIINSDLIGSIISYGKNDINQMLNVSNILMSLIKSDFV